MQSLPDDVQCVHFGREGVPSPAEWPGEHATGREQERQTDNGLRRRRRDEKIRQYRCREKGTDSFSVCSGRRLFGSERGASCLRVAGMWIEWRGSPPRTRATWEGEEREWIGHWISGIGNIQPRDHRPFIAGLRCVRCERCLFAVPCKVSFVFSSL